MGKRGAKRKGKRPAWNMKSQAPIPAPKQQRVLTHIVACAFIVLAVFVLSFLGVYGTPVFRDFSIIHEGGYRVSLGQVPYQDFYMPTGPVIFYTQAFFDTLVGAGLVSMMLHIAVLSSILAVAFYALIVRRVGVRFSVLLAIGLQMAFVGITAFPWYNQLAFFFFLLNATLLIRFIDDARPRTSVLLASSVLAFLGFYTKQDIGLMHAALVLLYFAFAYRTQLGRVALAYIMPIGVLIVGVYALFPGLSTWFMLGQHAAQSRVASFLSPLSVHLTAYTISSYIVLFALYVLWREWRQHQQSRQANPTPPAQPRTTTKGAKTASSAKRTTQSANMTLPALVGSAERAMRLLVIIVMVNLIVVGAQISSGLSIQTKLLAIPLTIYLVYWFIVEKMDRGESAHDALFMSRRALALALVFVILLLSFSQLSSGGLAKYFRSPTQQAFALMSPDRIEQGCYRGAPMPRDSLDDLRRIRSLIEEDKNGGLLVMGEYSFLYCDYGIEPPHGTFLWFHDGLTFSDNDVPLIERYIAAERPRVVLEEIYAAPGSQNREALRDFLYSVGYNREFVAASPYHDFDIGVYVLNVK